MYQHIGGGDGNIQAGGDVVLNPTPRYPENNPNIVKCPQCWIDTGRYSHSCPHCGYDVAGHFEALAREARRQQLSKAGWISSALGFGIIFVSQQLGLSLNFEFGVISFGAIVAALVCFRAAADL